MGSSRTRARTRVRCIGGWILNCYATREAPDFLISGKTGSLFQIALLQLLQVSLLFPQFCHLCIASPGAYCVPKEEPSSTYTIRSGLLREKNLSRWERMSYTEHCNQPHYCQVLRPLESLLGLDEYNSNHVLIAAVSFVLGTQG